MLFVLFVPPPSQWWANLKKQPSKNIFHKANICSTRRCEVKPQTPTDSRVFSLTVWSLHAEFHNRFPCFGNLGLSGGFEGRRLDNARVATHHLDRKAGDTRLCAIISVPGPAVRTSWMPWRLSPTFWWLLENVPHASANHFV